MELRASYVNQSTEGKENYYAKKFEINPFKQLDEYHQMMNYYLHGLQFVYEYCFGMESSWQFYYPYYYAPILSDLYFFVKTYV